MKEVSEVEIRGRSGKRPRLYGHLVTYDDGTVIYFARRRHREIYRGGCSSISEAIKEGKAGWAIDEGTLISMRARKAQYIGVRVIDNGDSYLTPISSYFKRELYKPIDYEGVGRGGSAQRVVLLSDFVKQAGKITVREDCIV